MLGKKNVYLPFYIIWYTLAYFKPVSILLKR